MSFDRIFFFFFFAFLSVLLILVGTARLILSFVINLVRPEKDAPNN